MLSFQTPSPTASMRYFEFGGTGIPLLMLHGLGCASSFEYPLVATSPALTGRHAILIDLLGFGFSDRPDDFGYRVEDHAEQVCAFVQSRGFEQIDLYGHSMGGSVAVEAADLLGNKVRHLILSEANLDSDGGEFSTPIAAMGERAYINGGHLLRCEAAEAVGDASWVATMRAASALAIYRGAKSLVEGSSPDWRSCFLRHPARKSYIFGQHSLPDPDHDALPEYGIAVHVVPDAGHSMGLENPAGLATAIAKAMS
ncbi:alpha/beta hydrolase [Rhizobium sp.]|uniref:alpha/beta fold hydrolase n=1 Tax=Rhizobium sp. TaxID=391 RepID=UPI0028999CE1